MDQINLGVVLAAGQGSRFSKDGISTPKPLIKVKGKSLLLRSIENLEEIGCSEIIVVLGYRASEIRFEIRNCYRGKSKLRFVTNSRFEQTNIYSLLSARKFIDRNFILVMADHFLSSEFIDQIKKSNILDSPISLFVDPNINSILDLEDATKVFSVMNKIIDIGKSLEIYNCIDTGVFICKEEVFESIDFLISNKKDVTLNDLIMFIKQNELVRTIEIKDVFWQDVDTKRTLDYVEDQNV